MLLGYVTKSTFAVLEVLRSWNGGGGWGGLGGIRVDVWHKSTGLETGVHILRGWLKVT